MAEVTLLMEQARKDAEEEAKGIVLLDAPVPIGAVASKLLG